MTWTTGVTAKKPLQLAFQSLCYCAPFQQHNRFHGKHHRNTVGIDYTIFEQNVRIIAVDVIALKF